MSSFPSLLIHSDGSKQTKASSIGTALHLSNTHPFPHHDGSILSNCEQKQALSSLWSFSFNQCRRHIWSPTTGNGNQALMLCQHTQKACSVPSLFSFSDPHSAHHFPLPFLSLFASPCPSSSLFKARCILKSPKGWF